MMEYKGYKAAVQFDDEAKILHGEVLGLRDVVTFQAASVPELEVAFRDSVDDYLEFCKERGEAPERPYSGKFLLRLDPALHRNVDVAAAAAGQSVNAWVLKVLELASDSGKRGRTGRIAPANRTKVKARVAKRRSSLT